MTDSRHHESIAARLKADADLAAAELDEQYRARLCRLVEREMNRRFRRKEDPEDVVQSAFRTFYRRNAQGEFHIDSSVDLWRLLETITRHKILKHVEKLGTGKRDTKREEYPEGDDLQGRDPTPEEAAIAADLMEKALAGLDETYVQDPPHAAAKVRRGRNRRQAGLHPSVRPHQVEPHSRCGWRDCRATTPGNRNLTIFSSPKKMAIRLLIRHTQTQDSCRKMNDGKMPLNTLVEKKIVESKMNQYSLPQIFFSCGHYYSLSRRKKWTVNRLGKAGAVRIVLGR